jgi:predicted Ser/Thr protein kinase
MDDDATTRTNRPPDEATRLNPRDDATVRVDRPDDVTAVAAAERTLTDVVTPPEDSAASGELAAGSVINDRFVIERVLGRGGMGVVYRARDLRKEETGDREPHVALKVLSGEFRRDPRMVVALQREARKAQTLAHPNIATVYDFDRDDNVFYLTMEELDGKPLNELIREHPLGMDRAQALSILRGMCLGLAYAHNKHIVHSDFKPGNVFFTRTGQTRILDFGIARAAPLERAEASEVTRFDAGVLGALTPSYASCEMFEGKDPHPADDVYALAIVAYQLFSGRHPFDNLPAPQARAQGLEPKPIRGLKRREWRALRHGLAFGRQDRSQHAAEFLRELEGTGRLRMVAAAAIVLGVVFAGYVGYVQFQEQARAAPDIPFEQLPADTQARIEQILEEGAMFARFGDEGSALMLYREAYGLHPRNKRVVVALETLLANVADRAAGSGDRAALERLRENLAVVMGTDDFLNNRRALVRVRERVDAALR